MTDKFSSIRHFNKAESKLALERILQHKDFSSALNQLLPEVSIEQIREECGNFPTLYDFQYAVPKKFVEYFLKISATEVTYSGLDNIDTSQNYLFIANHRDILLDSILLQNYFFQHKINTSKMAIGDNLLITPLIHDFAKLNKMFIVKRGGTIREKLENSRLLSEYIHYSILDEKESVWIAQRNGRTKDGIDKTQQGLIKMISAYCQKDVLGGLKQLKITPVTVSYEYESCDQLKARELALSENGKYEKKEGEDFESMKQGLFGFKGAINLKIGESIVDELDEIPSNLSNNDKINAVCRLIDQQIYKDYKLFPNNFIAYDEVEKTNEFASQYSPGQKEEFMEYLHKQSVVKDVSQEKMMHYLLQMYANPVKTHFGKKIISANESAW